MRHECFSLSPWTGCDSKGECCGERAPLSEVAGWQVRVERHFMEDMGNVCPFVQILDPPVPQTMDNVADALRILDLLVAEQVVDVPMISSSSCPSRAVRLEPQMAEQLVDVLTVLSVAVLQQRTAVVVIVFKVFPQDRIQQRRLRRSLTFQFRVVEVFKICAQCRVEQLHPLTLLVRMMFLQGFSHSSQWEKSVEVARQVGANMRRHVSSWTPAAYEQSIGPHEEDELLAVPSQLPVSGAHQRLLPGGKKEEEEEEEEASSSNFLSAQHAAPAR